MALENVIKSMIKMPELFTDIFEKSFKPLDQLWLLYQLGFGFYMPKVAEHEVVHLHLIFIEQINYYF